MKEILFGITVTIAGAFSAFQYLILEWTDSYKEAKLHVGIHVHASLVA